MPGKQGPHKVVDGFALIGEARLVVCLHDTIASPFPHSGAQVGLVALAHFALATESLQHDRDMRTATASCEWGGPLTVRLQCLGSGSLTSVPRCYCIL